MTVSLRVRGLGGDGMLLLFFGMDNTPKRMGIGKQTCESLALPGALL
jgi:hypothetical protein